MSSIVRPAIEKSLTAGVSRKTHSELWVSDLGRHPQKVMGRILHGASEDFSVETREIMQFGNLMEDDTANALRFQYPGMATQFPLYDDKWSGYADFVLGHYDYGDVTIVEHKATGEKWFDYKESLPRSGHVCQLWLYGWLYKKQYGREPYLVLYYRSWKNYAEFVLSPHTNGVRAEGVVNGTAVTRITAVYPPALRQEMETIFLKREMPDDLGVDPDDWEYGKKATGRLVGLGTLWKGGFFGE